jgi:hypothetical protein
MRKLDYGATERIETGGLKFINDWPGLFIRGDDCFSLSLILDRILRGEKLYPYDELFLQDLSRMIKEVTNQ